MTNHQRRDTVSAQSSRWHPAVLVSLFSCFALCTLLGIVLMIRGASGLKLLVIGMAGVAIYGKALLIKYEKEIAEDKERLRSLNS